MGQQTHYRKPPPSQQPAHSPHVGDRAGTGTGLPSPWAPHSTAVSVTLAAHLWEALKFLKISFDEDKNRGLVAGWGWGGQPTKRGLETELREESGGSSGPGRA